MDAKHTLDSHGCRVSADAESKRFHEISDKACDAADISRINTRFGFDFNERLGLSGAFDNQIDFCSSSGPQVGKAPVRVFVARQMRYLSDDEMLKRLAILVGSFMERNQDDIPYLYSIYGVSSANLTLLAE